MMNRETEEYLLKAGVRKSWIRAIKKKELREGAIKILSNVLEAFKWEEYDKIPMGYSPAGDCMGCDNHYIDFSECGFEDIGGVIDGLKRLSEEEEEGEND